MSETARLAVGIPSAVLIAWCAPLLHRYWQRSLFTAVYGSWVVWPVFGFRAVVLLVAVVGLAALPLSAGSQSTDSWTRHRSFWPAAWACVVALILSFVGAAVATDSSHAWHVVRTFLRDRHEVVVYVSGSGIATFVAGSAIAFLLCPLQEELVKKGETLASLRNAGTYIGWLERTVFFVLFVAGEPGAAGLALTAKSIARFPTLPDHKEGFAEYFLIGTLLSVALSGAAAIVVRLVLGFPALR